MKQKPKIEKDVFIKLMTFIKTWSKSAESKSNAIADILWNENMFSTKRSLAYDLEELFIDPEALDVLLNIIIEAMDDKETDWINYYIYELDWGRENDKLKVYAEDKVTEIPLKTLDDLYNILNSHKVVENNE